MKLLSETMLWIKYSNYNPDKVSTQGCIDINDFIKLLKNTMTPDFDTIPFNRISLRSNDECQEFDRQDDIEILFKEENIHYNHRGKQLPLIITILSPPQLHAIQPAISSSRHVDYKYSKSLHSSRSFLTNIAIEMEAVFPIKKLRPSFPAKIDDILSNRRENAGIANVLTTNEWTALQ